VRESVPLIRLERVSKSFDGGRSFAVREVSLAIPSGTFVAVVGGSGSGKTTTLKSINRLVDIDAGAIWVGGEAVRDLPGPALRRRIGYVFQGIGLFPHMSVMENVGITPRLLGWSEEQIAARASELLELVGARAGAVDAPPCRALRRPAATRRRCACASPRGPPSCSWTSLSARSTRSRAMRSAAIGACTSRWGPRR
jgi:ABC-type Fe3+/spermidine/putrescine transport system ATPase subunit